MKTVFQAPESISITSKVIHLMKGSMVQTKCVRTDYALQQNMSSQKHMNVTCLNSFRDMWQK